MVPLVSGWEYREDAVVSLLGAPIDGRTVQVGLGSCCLGHNISDDGNSTLSVRVDSLCPRLAGRTNFKMSAGCYED